MRVKAVWGLLRWAKGSAIPNEVHAHGHPDAPSTDNLRDALTSAA